MRKTVLFILIFAVTRPVFGQQATEEDTATVIRALEHKWVDPQTRNDNRALNLIFDNALVYVEYGRLITKGEYLARIRQAGPQVSQIVRRVATIRQFDHTAIVVGTYREKERGSAQSRVKRWRFIDTWAYKQNGWVLIAAAATRVSKQESKTEAKTQFADRSAYEGKRSRRRRKPVATARKKRWYLGVPYRPSHAHPALKARTVAPHRTPRRGQSPLKPHRN